MKIVQIRDAKAGFSGIVAEAAKGHPTLITRHGRPTAMVVPVEDGHRLYPENNQSFADYLLSMPMSNFAISRDNTPLRDIDL